MPNSQDIEIRSEEVQEILTKVPHWLIRYGISVIFMLGLGVLTVSWFVKYPDVISTQIMLTSLNPPEKLYTSTSGKLDAIFVADGDQVVTNQTLAVLESSAIYQDVFLLKEVIDTLTVNQTNFLFPINKLPPLVLGNINSSYAQFENNYNEYSSNRTLNPFENESFANQFALQESEARLQTLLSQKEIEEKKLALRRKNLMRYKTLLDENASTQTEYEGKQVELYQAEQSYKSMESLISQTKELISNAKRKIKNSEIANTQKESILLKKTLQSFYQLKKSLKDWERQFLLKSSINGQASLLKIWNKNQTVKAGDLVFTIIPSNNESYVGKITAPPSNSGKIEKGQKVQIKLTNYPSDEYGEVNGAIKSISPIPDAEGNYLIDVRLPQELITTYDRHIEFTQEMQGVADIVTEDLRLIERLFYQVRGLFN